MARILIIDDEEQVRLYLRKTLETEGYEVVDAPGGKGRPMALSPESYRPHHYGHLYAGEGGPGDYQGTEA